MNASENASVLYLELCALGYNMSTGDIDETDLRAVSSPLPPSRAELLLARVKASREELSALIVGQGDRDLDAVREEGRS
jgi:hypothetical protein